MPVMLDFKFVHKLLTVDRPGRGPIGLRPLRVAQWPAGLWHPSQAMMNLSPAGSGHGTGRISSSVTLKQVSEVRSIGSARKSL